MESQPGDLAGIDAHLALGVLARIAGLTAGEDGSVEFAALRQATGLLPEKLVSFLGELRQLRYLEYQENATGNPFGLLRLTRRGREMVEACGAEAELMLDRAPRSYRSSAPERSTRRGGRRLRAASGGAVEHE